MGKIIAFTGAHGTGKTTSVFEYAARMKKEGRYEIGIITETARRCPLPIFSQDSGTSIWAQNWIFAEQMKCEIEAAKNYRVTIADRTLIDVIAYSLLAGLDALADAQLEIAKHNVYLYDRVYFKPIGSNGHLVNDGFRSLDPYEQGRLETLLVAAYRQMDIPLIPVVNEKEMNYGINSTNI